MAVAAISAALYGIEWVFSGIETLITLGEAADVAGLGATAYEFGEGELALFSDFGSNSAELGQSIKLGASRAASAVKSTRQAVETSSKLVSTVKGLVSKPKEEETEQS